MKKFIFTIIIFCLSVNPVWSTNTYTADLEFSSSQSLSRTDTNLSAGFPGKDSGGHTGDMTLEGWFNFESLGAAAQSLPSKWLGAGAQRTWMWLLQGTTEKMVFYYSDDGANVSSTISDASVAASTATWYHLAVSVDVSAQDVKMYLNGELIADGGTSGSEASLFLGTASFEIGSVNSGTAQFSDYKVDTVRLWNDVRTGAEILASYNCTPLEDDTGLVDEWDVDNSLASVSGNNTLTNNNSATFQSASLPFTDSCGGAPPAGTTASEESDWIIFN